MQVIKDLWAKICELYMMYSDFIHSIFARELGDLVEYVLDIVVVCLIIKVIAGAAFHTKGGNG